MIMEKMGGMSVGLVGGVSDKASPTTTATRRGSDDVGLGLKLQSTESLPTRMMMSHHDDCYNLHRQILSSKPAVIGWDGGGGGGCGPISSSGTNEAVVRDTDTHCGSDSILRTLYPFHISSTTNLFKSPGGKEANMGFPFTEAQWKELERQAMIYKYMMSSVPVPPHLLLPFSLGSGSILNLRVSGNNKDGEEPGRCKRTDGKKWRCSRDVAPHQKYCERHLNRGRPRSRKPVEQLHAPPLAAATTTAAAVKKARLLHRENHHLPSAPSPVPIPTPQLLGSNTTIPIHSSMLVDKSPAGNLLSASPYKEIPRGLDWIMEGEMGAACESERQWQQLMNTDIGFDVFRQDYREEELLNLISYTDFGAPQDLVPLESESHMGTPRDFIDAWSNDKKNINEGSNLSPSLTLSMAMAARNDLVDEDMGHIQMGLGVTDSCRNYGISNVSWMGSEPGGPLAEALRPGTVGPGGDTISPPATTVSSPSGVIQRTVVSQSDSSGCNSPTLAGAPPPEMIGFKWLG